MYKYLLSIFLTISLFHTQASTPKDSLVMAWKFDDIISLDPAESFEISASEVIGNSYEKLVTYDINDVSKILPNIAESWTVSEDGKHFTFKIKKGLKFASGNPITANDVAYSYQRVIKLNLIPAFIFSQFGFTADNVDQKIVAKDDLTVELELNKSYSPSFFLYCLTSAVGSIVDEKLLKQHTIDNDFGNKWLSKNYAGSGSFKIDMWKPNEIVILTKNPNAIRPAKLNRVFLKFIAEPSVQRLLLEKGDIDIARNLQGEQIEALADNKDIHTQNRTKGTLFYIGLNQKNEYLKNPKVILALKYLIDYQGIENNVLNGQGEINQQVIPQGFLGAIKDRPYSHDLEKAKALLKEAGYENGFELNLYVRNILVRVEMAKAIQKTFKEAGIAINIIPSSGKQVLTKYRAREHDLFLGTWGADYQDPNTNASTFLYNADNSAKSQNKTLAWRNDWNPDKYNQLVENAVYEKDTAKRKKMYEDMQRSSNSAMPFIIIAQKREVAAERNNIKGFILGPSFDTNLYYNTSK